MESGAERRAGAVRVASREPAVRLKALLSPTVPTGPVTELPTWEAT
jgi:hypothetical protein